jgi:hypothetical protein
MAKLRTLGNHIVMADTERSLVDFIPSDWFSVPEKSSFWVTGYKIFVPEEHEIKAFPPFDFHQVRIMIFRGTINYPRLTGIAHMQVKEETLTVEGLKYENTHSPRNAWLLIFQPYIIDGHKHPEPEYLVKRKAGSMAGLYAAINGFNMAYERVFDFSSTMTGLSSCASPSFINPRAFPSPDLSQERLRAIHNAGKVIDKLEASVKRKVELALSWFEAGLRSTRLDSFIKYWVAIETIGMPDSSDVKPLNELLAKAYDLPVTKVSAKLGIGRIQNLRSRILHDGEDLTIHQDLSRYMEAIFLDTLLSSLGLPPTRYPLSIVENENFNLEDLTHTGKRGPITVVKPSE